MFFVLPPSRASLVLSFTNLECHCTGPRFIRRRHPRGYQSKQSGTQWKNRALQVRRGTAAPAPTPTLAERRTANATELERLRGIEAELKLRKRDLLHSDSEGNRIYAIDLASYNEAFAKATAEKNALAAAK